MENVPNIILFWFFILALFVLTIALMITAFILLKNGKQQSNHKMQLLGKMCLIGGTLCILPIIGIVGYVLYLYIM